MAKANRGKRPRGGESGGPTSRKAPPRNTNVRGGDTPRKKGTGKARRAERSQSRNRRPSVRPRMRGVARLRAAADGLLHLHPPERRVWTYFWPVLALAFAARAAIALSGDFVLHPDEIMQYLDQGHRLAFGNGVIYWEFFYGARSWLLPGLISGMLKLFDAVGLGEPFWYVDGIKLMFCAISLLIPAGMYFFARRHFGETAARVALVAGTFWYELAGFAHKPMTEFMATALMMALLVLSLHPSPNKPVAVWSTALLAVLAAAMRMPYAPLAIVLLGLFFLRIGQGTTAFQGIARARGHLTLIAVLLFLAVGVFDALTWDAGLFHSYLANLHFNLSIQRGATDVSPVYQYLWWLALAGLGLSPLCAALALGDLRRYGFLLALVVLVLIIHSSEAHKEYRYVFVVIPFWLLIGADLLACFAARTGKSVLVYGTAGVTFAAVSLAGILNALPRQDEVYRSTGALPVRFIRDQDSVFPAYRYLADTPGVIAVWQVDRPYFNLPGYYYLHRKIPLYDASTGPGNNLHKNLKTLQASVSHIVSGDPKLAVPGYAVEKEFGNVRVLRRIENDAPVRQWRDFTPTIVHDFADRIMRPMVPDAPPLPSNAGIAFVE